MYEQSPEQRRRALHLIPGGPSRNDTRLAVTMADVSQAETTARELRAEAVAIEAWYGANAYSRYLMKHGRRPDPMDAATIGRVIGAQVKASDGTMQPRLTKAERAALRRTRNRKKIETRLDEQAEQVKRAMEAISANETYLADIIRHANSQLDESRFGTLLQGVLTSLNRFAEGWANRGKADRTPKPA